MAERLRDFAADPATTRPPASTPEPADAPAPARDRPAEPAEQPAEAPGGPLLAAPDPYVDGLTDLLGPEIFERLLAAESARCRRYRRPAALVIAEMAGLDDLARSWGGEVAREAVVALATVLRTGSRTSDYVARIATHRFAIILTETDEIAAINYVERVREAWEGLPAIAAGALRVGFGWAGTPSRATLADARPTAEEVLRDDLRARPA